MAVATPIQIRFERFDGALGIAPATPPHFATPEERPALLARIRERLKALDEAGLMKAPLPKLAACGPPGGAGSISVTRRPSASSASAAQAPMMPAPITATCSGPVWGMAVLRLIKWRH